MDNTNQWSVMIKFTHMYTEATLVMATNTGIRSHRITVGPHMVVEKVTIPTKEVLLLMELVTTHTWVVEVVAATNLTTMLDTLEVRVKILNREKIERTNDKSGWNRDERNKIF